MHQNMLRVLKKKEKGTTGKAFHLTDMKNVADLAASSSSSSDNETPESKTVHRPGQSTYLKDLLAEAKNVGEDTVTDQAKRVERARATCLPANQLASLQSILATLGRNRGSTYERDHWERERLRQVTGPIDINGLPNYSSDPVYYRPNASFVKHVAGVPYAVSDILYTCNRCTYHNKCERHGEPVWQKTDVSLCRESHLRIAVSWDVTDPENRKGTWRFDIEEKFDRFSYPKEEREDHEQAQAVKRKAQDNDEEMNELDQGCCPIEPKWRIKELAKRIVEDYNNEAKTQARREFLDPKGREYFSKPYHWGGKDPFTPSESSQVRAARQYVPVDGNRVERELRVLLQAWYKSQLKPEQKMRDRTTANMRKVWAFKMEKEKAARLLKSVKTEGLQSRMMTSLRRVQEGRTDRYKMTTWDLKKLGATRKAAETPKTKAASRDLTAEERKILKKMSEAAEAEAKEAAEKESPEPTQESALESEELDVATDEEKKLATRKFSTGTSKRKAAEVSDNESNKKYKPANIIDDSDDEADYGLLKAPKFELPEQREGWELAEALSTKVEESMRVAQSDELPDVTEIMVVVEQGTSIIEEIENAASEVLEEQMIESSPAIVAEANTLLAYASPTPDTDPISSLSKKRKAPFADLFSSDSEDGQSPAKKVKKVSFALEITSSAQTPSAKADTDEDESEVGKIYIEEEKIHYEESEEEGEVSEQKENQCQVEEGEYEEEVDDEYDDLFNE